MNREPLSQSTDNYSPCLMSMDCPQHSRELTHSSPDTRNCKQQSFHGRWFPAEVPEKTKVRLCGRAPPAPVPGTTLLLNYSFFLILKLPACLQKVTVKVSFERTQLHWFFPLCLFQKQQEFCQGNVKSFYQNRPLLCQKEQPPTEEKPLWPQITWTNDPAYKKPNFWLLPHLSTLGCTLPEGPSMESVNLRRARNPDSWITPFTL